MNQQNHFIQGSANSSSASASASASARACGQQCGQSNRHRNKHRQGKAQGKSQRRMVTKKYPTNIDPYVMRSNISSQSGWWSHGFFPSLSVESIYLLLAEIAGIKFEDFESNEDFMRSLLSITKYDKQLSYLYSNKNEFLRTDTDDELYRELNKRRRQRAYQIEKSIKCEFCENNKKPIDIVLSHCEDKCRYKSKNYCTNCKSHQRSEKICISHPTSKCNFVPKECEVCRDLGRNYYTHNSSECLYASSVIYFKGHYVLEDELDYMIERDYSTDDDDRFSDHSNFIDDDDEEWFRHNR